MILRLKLGLRPSRAAMRGASALCLIALYAMAFHRNLPERATEYGSNYWEGNYEYYETLLRETRKPALVFIPDEKIYLRVAFTLPPSDADPVIFALNLDEDNVRLMNYYPCRVAYVMRKKKGLALLREPNERCENGS